jgi:hypothetical protein
VYQQISPAVRGAPLLTDVTKYSTATARRVRRSLGETRTTGLTGLRKNRTEVSQSNPAIDQQGLTGHVP